MPSDEKLKTMATDPALSYWFKNALVEALKRDPVDAANDAGLLSLVLDKRAAELLAAAGAQTAMQNDWVDDEGVARVTPKPAPHKRPPVA